MEKIISVIAKNIKKYRKLNDMTQKELAQIVGVSIAAVSNWETGSNSIDIDSLFKVCDALHVPISAMTAPDYKESDSFSGLEKEIIYRYRDADPLTESLILKMLDIQESKIPKHLLAYFAAFKGKGYKKDTT